MGSRGWERSWERFPESRPLPAEGGLTPSRARGPLGEHWWSQRFVGVLESYGLGARMQRGRRYARSGQVLSLDVRAGQLLAQVQGSRVTPYLVTVEAGRASESQWQRVDEVLGSRVGFAARLLAGTVPPELEDAFDTAGVQLFPARWSDLAASCSCPDGANPCKHIAAVLYLFADRLDDDPWLLLAWRGRTRDQVLAPLMAQTATPLQGSDDADLPPWWPLEPTGMPLERVGLDPLDLVGVPSRGGGEGVLHRLAPLDVEVRGEPVTEWLGRVHRNLMAPLVALAFVVAGLAWSGVLPAAGPREAVAATVELGNTSRAALADGGSRAPLPVGDGALPTGGLVGSPAPGSVALDCSAASARHTISVDTHLDPACDWKGFDVVASGVTLDCRGARLEGIGRGRWGILIATPATVTLRDVTVRNCEVAGFLNGVRVTRDGFRSLTPSDGYDHTTERITIQNLAVHDSTGVGIFVDGFVSDVHIRDVDVTRAGSSGIYLDGDSRNNEITGAHVHRNGHRENGPGGQIMDFGGTPVWWWGTGREGISIDGSAGNHVHGNVIEFNTAGGVFLYKNCGEFVHSRPDRWWPRYQGSDDNRIEANVIRGEQHGVWVGSRMAQNQRFMECSDPAYGEGPFRRYHEDQADDNVVVANRFEDVVYGVRVEDDHTTVQGNTFLATTTGPDSLAVLVGTKVRSEHLNRPVVGTVVVGNDADIAGVAHPYRWIPAQEGTAYVNNRSRGTQVDWCEGDQPKITFALFVVALVIPAPEVPPPPLEPLPPVPQPPCRSDDPVATPTSTGSTSTAPPPTVSPPTSTTAPATTTQTPTDLTPTSAASGQQASRPAVPVPVSPAFAG